MKILSFTGEGVVSPYALPEIHNTLLSEGHDLQVIDAVSMDRASRYPVTISKILSYDPDLILSIDLIGILPAYFFLSSRLKIVSLFYDNPADFFTENDLKLSFPNYFISSIDKDFVKSYKKEKNGAQVFYAPWSTDKNKFYNMQVERDFDVSFVGSCTDERKELLSQIAERFSVHVWGDETWKDISSDKFHFHGPAHPRDDTPEIYNRSKIVIAPNALQLRNGLSERLYNVMACGAMALTDYRPVVEEHFQVGSELDIYIDGAGLCAKLDHYLENHEKRANIAKAGMHKVNRDFSSTSMLNQVFSQVNGVSHQEKQHLAVLENIKRRFPKNCAEVLEYLGRYFFNESLVLQASGYFSQALLLDETRVNAYLGVIASLNSLGNSNLAKFYYEKLESIDSEKAKIAKIILEENVAPVFEYR